MKTSDISEAYADARRRIEKEVGFALDTVEFVTQYESLVKDYILLRKEKKHETPLLIGIQGPIGIGKTTLVTAFKHTLSELGYRAESVSIDNFYHSYQNRKDLSAKYSGNPLYQISRGMPGTHDVAALSFTLQEAKKGKPFSIPYFDKSYSNGEGDTTRGGKTIFDKLDFLFVEGWCLFMKPTEVDVCIRCMEENPSAKYALKYTNIDKEHIQQMFQELSAYQEVWNHIEHSTYLIPEDISFIEDWRVNQEDMLKKSKGEGKSEEEVRIFAKYFIPFAYYISRVAKDEKQKHVIINSMHKVRSI